jgi:hypothetical protein
MFARKRVVIQRLIDPAERQRHPTCPALFRAADDLSARGWPVCLTGTGKWHSLAFDSHRNPYVSYDAYVNGSLKCAHWDGKVGNVRTVDSRFLHG